MPLLEPTITTHDEYVALVDGLNGEPLDAIIWVGEAGIYNAQNMLIETVYYMNASSQGFRAATTREPTSATYWFPWGVPYIFYVQVQDEPPAKRRRSYIGTDGLEYEETE